MRSYSPSTGGFYDSALHGDQVPPDAVTITAKKHAELLDAQSRGASIVVGKGARPVARFTATGRAAQLARAGRLVRREARRRILAIASLERQVNDNAAIASAALAIAATGATTIDVAPALERRRQIDAVRAASNALEAELERAGTDFLEAYDAEAAAGAWKEAR